MGKDILEQGQKLNNRYTLYRSLGQGGFGITYVAKDELLNQNVVIKEYFPVNLVHRSDEGKLVLPDTQEEITQYENGKKCFLNEARVLASLFEVRSIVKVLECFRANDTAYIVMEYVKGITLRSYIEQNEEEYSFQQIYQMMEPVMDALERVHRKGLVHRDLNPDNIMVEEDGTLKILDFGSARQYFLDQDREKTMTILVKNGYAPPEQYDGHGKQGPWTDIYALCATMYEMMTGCVPQNAKEREIQDELYTPSAYGVEIEPEQEEMFLKKGLALSVEQRFSSIKKMREAFAPKEIKQKKSTHKKIAVLGILFLFTVAVCAAVYVKMHPHKEEVVYAGNYARGSEEYDRFLSYVEENAVKTEESGEKKIYTLTEKVAKEWGQSSNVFCLDAAKSELFEALEKAGYDCKKIKHNGIYEVTVEPYGVIQTEFMNREKYQLPGQVEMVILYDVVSEQLENIYIYPETGSDGDIYPVMTEVAYILSDEIEEDREELEKGLRKTGTEFYEKTQAGEQIKMGYDFEDCEMLFVMNPDVTGCFLKYGISRLGIVPPYNWP